jgi:hypothetical protein
VYAVTKSLPEKQREDIERELRALIDDMVEQDVDSKPNEAKIKAALLELGDPEVLADNYRGSKRYLIGPKFYDKYLLVLKIVLSAVFIGVSVAMFFGSFFDAQKNVKDIVTDYFDTIFSGLLQAFAWVTVGFVIAERNVVNLKEKDSRENNWDVSKLPAIPNKKASIPLSEPIVSIIFTTIFIALLFSAPQVFAAYLDNKTVVIPVFNLDVIYGYRALLVGIYIVSVLRDILKLYYRRWNLRLSVMLAVLTVISTILLLTLFTNSNVWNAGFASELVKHFNLNFNFVKIWWSFKNWLVAVVVLVGAIEIIVGVYKGIRYNTVR